MKDTVRKLLSLFDKREKKKLLFLLALMVFGALFETVGIGLIAPFVGIVTNPSLIHDQDTLAFLYDFFNFKSTLSFIISSVIVLLLVFVLKNLYLLFFYYTQFKIILNQRVKLSRTLFKEYLTKPYTFHLNRNSSELLRNINGEVVRVFEGIIISSFNLFTEFLVIFFVVTLLLLFAPVATLTVMVLLGGSVVLFFVVFRKKINTLGEEQQVVSAKMIKWVNQGLGASKEVKVSGKENFFINAYSKHSQIQANNSRYIKMLQQAPRLFIETIVVSIVLVTLMIIILQDKSTTELVTTMALFTMAAFRLMPSINRVMGLITGIRYSYPALDVVYNDLFSDEDKTELMKNEEDRPTIINKGERTYKDSIELKQISFRYPNQADYSVKDVSLTIPIGQSVAFIGESGAGKTTLVDIILGVLTPEKGRLLVDGKSIHIQRKVWQQKIGYIPQFIYLSDDSIRRNVAFGIEEDQISDEEVWRALKQAQLMDFVKELPEQLDTSVGERGVRLSGGQRQRIGIARALYHNPEILFMDEATSALDNETERGIMKAIDGLKGEKTLIIIAHRLSTIENCDIVFKISNGKIASVNKRIDIAAN